MSSDGSDLSGLGVLMCLPVVFAFLGAAGMVSCEKQTDPVTPKPSPPGPTIGPEPIPEHVTTCETACENQRDLGCELGEPTPEGTTCEEVCQNSEQSGIPGLAWDVDALTQATTCTE